MITKLVGFDFDSTKTYKFTTTEKFPEYIKDHSQKRSMNYGFSGPILTTKDGSRVTLITTPDEHDSKLTYYGCLEYRAPDVNVIADMLANGVIKDPIEIKYK